MNTPTTSQPRSAWTNASALVTAFIFGATVIYGFGAFSTKSSADTESDQRAIQALEVRLQTLDDRQAQIESREASVETGIDYIRESLGRIEHQLGTTQK